MENDIWKVKIIEHLKYVFENECDKNDLFYKPYPCGIYGTYRMEGDKEAILDTIGYCISTIEPMPMISLSQL